MIPAARLSDMHVCPMVTGIIPHVGGPVISPGGPTTLTGMLPTASAACTVTCVGPPDVLLPGSTTVLISNKPAVRLGDSTAHGGKMVLGCFTVLMG